MLTDIVSLFRIERFGGRAPFVPDIEELNVVVELEPADVLVSMPQDVARVDPRSRLVRELHVITPARLPTDELDD